MPFLRGLFRSGPASAPVPPLPRPDPPICIIGDLHGMAGLLDAMLDRIAILPDAAAARIVLVGDLIDRGPHSAQVLSRVRSLCQAEPDRIISLMGNHERMMLDFLADPAAKARRWIDAGGVETLQSLGVTGRLTGTNSADRFTALAGALHGALPPGMKDWLAELPLSWQADGLAVVHADADPDLPLAAQSEATLLWGRRQAARPRSDGLWLAHGHVIVPEAGAGNGRIRVDTGAWRSGRLSAIWLDRQGARVLEVTASP